MLPNHLSPAQREVLEWFAQGPAFLLSGARRRRYEHQGRTYIEAGASIRRGLGQEHLIQHDGAVGTWSITELGRILLETFQAREAAARARRNVEA